MVIIETVMGVEVLARLEAEIRGIHEEFQLCPSMVNGRHRREQTVYWSVMFSTVQHSGRSMTNCPETYVRCQSDEDCSLLVSGEQACDADQDSMI